MKRLSQISLICLLSFLSFQTNLLLAEESLSSTTTTTASTDSFTDSSTINDSAVVYTTSSSTTSRLNTSSSSSSIIDSNTKTSATSSSLSNSSLPLNSSNELSNSSDANTSISSTRASSSETIAGSLTTPTVETSAGETALYRLYHEGLQSHLYTKDSNEYRVLASKGWKQEGTAWYTSLDQGDAVYRLYQPELQIHLYTKDNNEYKILATRGWKQEGVAFRSYGTTPIYRLYHDSLKKHLYTKDSNEYRTLATKGWRQEGVAFLAVDKTHTRAALYPPTGQLVIQQKNNRSGSFDILITNIFAPYTIQSIKIPVWSSVNGQDDLVWYTPVKQTDGSYKITIHKKNHKNSLGTYNIHLYYTIQGVETFITSQQTQLAAVPLANNLVISTQLTPQNEVKITITNVDDRITELKVPIWSDTNGQDDIIWYTAQKINTSTYQVTISLKKHYFTTGLYHSHFYAKSADDLSMSKASSFTVNQLPHIIESPHVAIDNKQSGSGILNVIVTESIFTKQITSIKLAAWSTANQSNLHWYNLSPTGSQTVVPIRINNHGYLAGIYHLHAYIEYADKTKSFMNLGTQSLHSPYPNSLSAVLQTASSLIGVRGGTPQHAQLVSDYNSVTPLPVGYSVKLDDDWCDIFITVIFQRLGLSHLIGRECGVERHIQIFQSLGIWNEDGNSIPQTGDIITFDWDTNTQPNDGFTDHIGIVERVENGRIYTIEGNSFNEVKRNSYVIGDGHIRGFARPRY